MFKGYLENLGMFFVQKCLFIILLFVQDSTALLSELLVSVVYFLVDKFCFQHKHLTRLGSRITLDNWKEKFHSELYFEYFRQIDHFYKLYYS